MSEPEYFDPETYFADDPEGLAWFHGMTKLHERVRAELQSRFSPDEYATHVLRHGKQVTMVAPDGSAREVELLQDLGETSDYRGRRPNE